MTFSFHIHWKLRKGLGPDWIDKVAEVGLDDLPSETTEEEAKELAIADFKSERLRNRTKESEYLITDIIRD